MREMVSQLIEQALNAADVAVEPSGRQILAELGRRRLAMPRNALQQLQREQRRVERARFRATGQGRRCRDSGDQYHASVRRIVSLGG